MEAGTVLIMRHAEKSDDPLNPNLSSAGYERAQRLADFIPAKFGKPQFLFGSATSKHSRRPIETLEPLAKTCGLAINTDFADQDYGALAHTVLESPGYDDALVVICWHHGNIPPLAHAFKAEDGQYPDPWKRSVFNLVLRFDILRGSPRVTQITEPF